MAKDSALLQFPLAPVEVHIGAADAARLKLHAYSAPFNFRFRYFFDFDVVGSTVNSGFQKESTLNIVGLLAGIKFVVPSSSSCGRPITAKVYQWLLPIGLG
jgi:hypothetical protein